MSLQIRSAHVEYRRHAQVAADCGCLVAGSGATDATATSRRSIVLLTSRSSSHNSNLQIVLIGAFKRSSGDFEEDWQTEVERIHGVVERLADYCTSVNQTRVKENIKIQTFVNIDDVVNPNARMPVCFENCQIDQQQIDRRDVHRGLFSLLTWMRVF